MLGSCNMQVIVLVVFAVVVVGDFVDDKVDKEVDDIVVEAVLGGGEDELRVLPAIEMFKQIEKQRRSQF